MVTTTRTRTRRWAVGLIALPLALAGCGTQHAGSASGGGDLPMLHVGTRSAAGMLDAGAAAGASAGSGSDSGYPLVGTLPSGPTTAVVYRFPTGATSSDLAQRLATSLHLTTDPVRHDHGWVVAQGGSELRVRDDGSWSFWREDATCPYRVDVDNADSSTVAVGCAAPIPVPKDTVTDAEALAAAYPVLQASGATGTPAVNRSDLARVSASRSVDGLAVVGGDTSVTVDATGVLDASGTSGAPVAGPAYPIITAAQALEVLRWQPKPAIACAIGATCPGVGPEHVTGARLGLVPSDDGTDPVLLPAWLFTVTEQTYPIPVMAVQDQYLADPTPGPAASGWSSPGSSGGGSAGSVGASAVPDSPVPVPPASDAPAPASTSGDQPVSRTITIDRATLSADGRTLTLWGEGGVCATYAADGKEDGDHVYAVLTATPSMTAGMACPDLAKQVSASMTLQAPLGTRTVLDAGLPSMPKVPVARS